MLPCTSQGYGSTASSKFAALHSWQGAMASHWHQHINQSTVFRLIFVRIYSRAAHGSAFMAYRPFTKTILIKYYSEGFVLVSGAPPKTEGLCTKYYSDIKYYSEPEIVDFPKGNQQFPFKNDLPRKRGSAS